MKQLCYDVHHMVMHVANYTCIEMKKIITIDDMHGHMMYASYIRHNFS